MNRTAIRIANGALLVLCCFLAARVIAAVAGEALTPAAVGAVAAAAAGPEQGTPWSERKVILDRNLFNASTLAPSPPPEPEEELPKTKLSLRLLGTAAAADPAQSRAALEYLDDRTHHVVAIGDRLKGEAEVLRIERRRLVLLNRGKREELALEQEVVAPGKPRARRAAAKPTRRPRRTRERPQAARPQQRDPEAVEQLGRNRFAVPRAGVEDVASNPAALFSQARILPKYQDGEMIGVQLNAIKAGSLFEEIGIQNGDTITELNGIQVTGQEQSAEIIRQLTDASEFNVTVTGQDGAVRQLRYEVR